MLVALAVIISGGAQRQPKERGDAWECDTDSFMPGVNGPEDEQPWMQRFFEKVGDGVGSLD